MGNLQRKEAAERRGERGVKGYVQSLRGLSAPKRKQRDRDRDGKREKGKETK